MMDPKWFIGEVVDIENDPEKLGRVRVKIFQKHDFIKQADDFIWSHVMMPTTSDSLKGVGQTPSFSVGTRVVGFFADGEMQRVSVITGTLVFNPLEDNGASEHSLSFMARGQNAIERKKIGFEEPDSSFAAQYPYNRVLQTKSGHVVEIDDTAGEERIHVYHKAGAYIEINKDGRISISTPDDSIEIVGKNKTIEIKGDAKIAVEGNLDASVIGDASVSSAGKMYIGALGDLELSAGGGMTISAGGGVTVRAPGAGLVSTGPITSVDFMSSALGATGSFATPTGKIVTVSKGVITSIK